MTSETNPENGTTTYTYDSATVGGCSFTSNGDLIIRTNAAGVSECPAYDALHRILSIGHNPAQANSTPDKFFVYDAATVNGVVMTNVKGRLAEAYTCMSPCTKLTDEGFSYTVRGEVSDLYESTQHSGGYYHSAATYWANGVVNLLTAPGGYSAQYNLDGEGRVYSTAPSVGALNSTTYNAASQPTQVTFASGDSDTFTYDPNTNRMTQYKFTVNSQSEIGTLTWNANHTLQSLDITDPFNSADTQNCSFTHDDLTRLASVNCGAIWSQTFSYDAFGNISKSGTSIFLPIYKDASGNTTNRFVSIPGTIVSYDNNGNVLGDGSHTYTWNSDNKPLTVDSVGVTYDALGRVVEQNRSGAYSEFMYAPAGTKIGIMNGQSYTKSFVPLPGGAVAVYGGGIVYFGHSDHLGSIRLGSTSTRTIAFDVAYAPFGETYAPSGSTDPSFTGQRQDTVVGLYDFPDRQYSTQGRWPTPDPLGRGSVTLADPQTLNRYAYVRNNPLSMVDPQGLCGEDGGFDDDISCDDEGETFYSAVGGNGGNQDVTSGGDQGANGQSCGANSSSCGSPTPPDSSQNTTVTVLQTYQSYEGDPNYTAEASADSPAQIATTDSPLSDTLTPPGDPAITVAIQLSQWRASDPFLAGADAALQKGEDAITGFWNQANQPHTPEQCQQMEQDILAVDAAALITLQPEAGAAGATLHVYKAGVCK